MSADRQYYFITLPFNDRAIGQRTAQIQFLKNELGLQSDVTHYALEVPALKIGTLDALMEASDELSRVDPLLEQITTKMLHLLEGVSGKPRADVARVRMDMTCDQYLLSFRWDDRRYDLRDALKTTIDRITHEIQAIDDKVRLKYIDYNETRKKLNQVHRKEGGNLTIRPLNDVVRAFNRNNYGDENPLETEYLVTLYVVLPSSSLREWTDSYWHLGGIEFVVPQSSKVILQDGEFTLVNVVLFRKFMEDFKKECRSRKWTIREGIFSETKHEAEKIQSTSEEQRGHLLHMLATNFSESFQGYVHIKVIRMFVESILRYGLPPNFVCFCMMLTDKQERSVRQRLEHVCTTVLGLKSSADEGDVGALQLEFPYVSLRLANVYRSK